MPSRRQTATFLIRRFQEAGIHLNTRRGQNFLIDLNLVQILVDSAEVTEKDVVLEVGTGTGSLTALLAPQAAEVVTVEVDHQLHQLASEELFEFDNVTMLRQDVLKNKNRIHPVVLDTVRERLTSATGRGFKLVSNLPYNIATPLISNLLGSDLLPDSMTVTIQKELADRITAGPGTKDYGATSVWVQSQCRSRIVRTLPPAAFWPRPKVDSAIIQVVPDKELRQRIEDIDFFHVFVRSMFFHRRKFLRSVMLSAYKGQLDKPAVDQIMEQHQMAHDVRTEQLGIETMLELCDTVRARIKLSGV